MKKLLTFISTIVLGLTLASCSNSSKQTIVFGTMAQPGEPLIEYIKDDFEAKGYTLKIETFSEFSMGNPGLVNGSYDATLFQHKPYLDTYNSDTNNNLLSATTVYTCTYGGYSYKINSVEELKRLNNLTSDILSIGEVLNVTNSYVPSTPSNSYVVKKGDSLYSIARKYNISVDDLKATNNKTSNLLSIGEVLIIPTSTSSKTYKVKAGDSLWKIATNYGVSVNALKEANGLSSNIISIGQVLVIP